MDQIANIARQTLKGLEEGQPWDDIIVACYVKMTRVVEQERGLLRQVAMTPAEFALKLERAGLPGEAVRTLTHLFEEVRYGARQQASREQRDLAVASLHAILRACGVNP